jgi:4-hydroxy-tetrahydrodipicolinate synthase
VDGLLIVTPFYNKTTQKGLVAHYGAICEQVHIPIIVYNVPSRTGLNVLPATMREIMDVCENVVGIKEASGNIEQIVNLAALCPGLDIYSGNDDHILPVLSVGGKGVISTIANVVPSEVHNLCMAFFAGKLDIARKLQFSLLPIWRAAFSETNPIPIKTMMGMMDLCSSELRLPLVPPSAENEAKMRKALKDFGLIS